MSNFFFRLFFDSFLQPIKTSAPIGKGQKRLLISILSLYCRMIQILNEIIKAIRDKPTSLCEPLHILLWVSNGREYEYFHAYNLPA